MPINYGETKKWNYIKGDPEHSLLTKSNKDLYEIFQKCHDILWEGGKKDPAEAFDEMSKIIFVKSADEFKTSKGQPYTFQIGNHEVNKKIEVANRIKKYFEHVKADKDHVFMEDSQEDENGKFRKVPSEIKSRAERLYKIVSLLQSIDLKNTDLDAKGRAFEQFLDTVFKSKLGQYFTHRNIVNFCIQIISPQEHELVLDPSCGSGGFLLYSLVFVRERLKENYDLDDKQEYSEFIERYKDYGRKKLFGIEKNEKIARVAMMDMVIYEDGSTNILDSDGLIDFSSFRNQKIREGKGGFNIILSNPPFGAKVDCEELESFSTFELGNERSQQASDILFIERNIKFLQPDFENPSHRNKEGGRMAIVLPDGILNNNSLWYVRQFIQANCYVRAIISLPSFAFKKTGSGSKTSLVFLKKFTQLERNAYLEAKVKIIPQKEAKLQEIQNKLRQDLINFIGIYQIEQRLADLIDAVNSTWESFVENLDIIKIPTLITQADGSNKEVSKRGFDASVINEPAILQYISQAQELFNSINKEDRCFDEYEENQHENLLRYYDEIKELHNNLNKFLEPADKIIKRQQQKVKKIKKTESKVRNETEKQDYEVEKAIEWERMVELIKKFLKIEVRPSDETIKECLIRISENSSISNTPENPLWISTSSQVNTGNLISFLKFLGFDIFKDLKNSIRALEIMQEQVNNYIPGYEAHKEVMENMKYPVFMAIADRIGYDSTARVDKNDLYKETWTDDGENKVRVIDSQNEDTILGQWNRFKLENNIIF